MVVRKRRGANLVAGLAAGVLLGLLVKLMTRGGTGGATLPCRASAAAAQRASDPLALVGLQPGETVHNSNRTLVFVGVMTAEQYLTTRARAVRETWAGDLPGKLVFFSSASSRDQDAPLVALPGVDDSYPPQKKSFMMILHMYEKYGDKFEWFMRADDDVYVRGDRLETFLRSVDSRKAQFIGQAGRGTGDEKDALALDYDQNFCMGGPGILISRETLRRVAPHVRYCLKHLYSTHEDVELGRCVAKFAGVSCTWSYDMQTILHHNSSGNAAYTGRLKRREVHRAITLHPVKDYRLMYRLHSYFKNLKIQELRESSLDLHRDISAAAVELHVAAADLPHYDVAPDQPLFPVKLGQPGYLGNNHVLGANQDLIRYNPKEADDILTWDFISKSLYSHRHANPKRKIETAVKESLDDVVREVMELINAPSKQRGRIIDFCEILYGYTRLDPVHGADHVLDILLKYRRYRGRKLTTTVRRHAYLQQSFTGMEVRELPMGERPPLEDLTPEGLSKQLTGDYQNPTFYEDYDDSSQQQNTFLNLKKFNIPIKEAFENGLMKLSENFPKVFSMAEVEFKEYSVHDRVIKFILPLSGRYETFVRFLNNYEEICLKTDEATLLIVVLYIDSKNPSDFDKTLRLIRTVNQDYTSKQISIIEMGKLEFSRGAALTRGLDICKRDDLVFFIDVDITFNLETLRRVRINTIKNTQVYFPIVFSEYNPRVISEEDYNKFKNYLSRDSFSNVSNINNVSVETDPKTKLETVNAQYTKVIDDDYGYFRQYGFGILALYKCDLENVGGFDTNIKGWGLEDVHLYDTLIQSNLSVFRVADDSLNHVFHSVQCERDNDLSRYQMCLGTKASTHASLRQVTYYALNYPHLLWPPDRPKGLR